MIDFTRTDLDKDGIVLPVLRLSAVSRRRIFPVEIQSVEVVLTEESNGASDERFPAGGVGDQRAEPPVVNVIKLVLTSSPKLRTNKLECLQPSLINVGKAWSLT